VIYVTVGTADKGIDFVRLVREMDRIAGALAEDVLIQRGPVDHEPVHARHVRYVKFDEALRLIGEAKVVVGHCGAGTVINALRLGRPLIVVPRRAAHGELDTDDHQVQLAERLRGTPGVRVVDDIADLEAAVREFASGTVAAPRPSPEKARLTAAVREFLAGPPQGAGGGGR